MNQYVNSSYQCFYVSCCRRNSSHCKSATQFAPQKYVSLITEKFPKEEGGQWPTSVTHFAKVTYLRPPTRLFHSPTLRRLGLCCDRSKPPRGIDVEQSSPRPDWIQNSQAHPAGRSQKLPPEAEQWRQACVTTHSMPITGTVYGKFQQSLMSKATLQPYVCRFIVNVLFWQNSFQQI